MMSPRLNLKGGHVITTSPLQLYFCVEKCMITTGYHTFSHKVVELVEIMSNHCNYGFCKKYQLYVKPIFTTLGV